MRKLGRTLRDLRERNRMTQEEVAKRMRSSNSKLSRLEHGQLPNFHEYLAMLDLYGIIPNNYPPYVALYERAKEKGWWHAYGIDDRGFVSLEAEACKEREHQLGYIPGLLQTEEYMRANFAGARKPIRGKKLENELAVRLRRQLRLTEEPVLQVHAIIDETVLRRPILRPAAHRRQLEHVLEVAELSTVKVQVLPIAEGAHSGRNGSFIILSYPDPEDPDIAYLEHGFGSLQTEKEAEVSVARLAFDHLARLAGKHDSAALIREVIAET
ncbi:helix-turn-helix domain-containing protein [Amycolatopsis anabasis]|uniref:helix-turn-helix domain-containing protein n=1 Tax=Amycolatopsis anabasis TaxID=1840409 RepID=UPI001FEB7B00|nr:helix-turn-helix transcriptional regulator [Amycolatopsis anabasis]